MNITLLHKSLTKIDTIELDATITESHSGEVDVTEHPVEKGANITDHARVKPDVLTIEGVISNTPLNRTQTRRKVSSRGGFVFETSSTDSAVQGQPGIAEDAYTKLQTLRKSRQLITVQTRFQTYTDMIMTSLVVPRNAGTGDALRFTAVFKHIKLVTNKSTTAAITKEPKAKPKVSKGKQLPANTAAPVKEQSILFTLRESSNRLFQDLGLTSPTPKP